MAEGSKGNKSLGYEDHTHFTLRGQGNLLKIFCYFDLQYVHTRSGFLVPSPFDNNYKAQVQSRFAGALWQLVI
jgi:hypothetical protein